MFDLVNKQAIFFLSLTIKWFFLFRLLRNCPFVNGLFSNLRGLSSGGYIILVWHPGYTVHTYRLEQDVIDNDDIPVYTDGHRSF